jgi:Raf kinase inhibitor-like YbhB/YbcL family protein
MDLHLTSKAFHDGQSIPTEFTGDGLDKSPPLSWNEPPNGTKAFALMCEDPDAPKGTFTHWMAFNIPPEARELGEGLPKEQKLANGAMQGKNDMGRIGYAGPAPPHGKPHRYQFELYALDSSPELQPGITAKDLRAAISGHVLAEGRLTGTYKRT